MTKKTLASSFIQRFVKNVRIIYIFILGFLTSCSIFGKSVDNKSVIEISLDTLK
jgi:hypothetical protein